MVAASVKRARRSIALQDKTNTQKTLLDVPQVLKGAKSTAMDPISSNERNPRRSTTDRTSASTRKIAPAKRAHRPPRLTRKPVRTTRKKDNAVLPETVHTSKEEALEIAPRSTRRASSRMSSAVHSRMDDNHSGELDEEVQQNTSQRVAESIYHSSNVPAATPSALEHSILALKNFRRRPRQLSMLNMVKQRLASARSSLSGAGDNLALDDSDDSFELGDDFLPDAAGTPMYSSGIDAMGLRGVYSSSRDSEVTHGPTKRKRTSGPSLEEVDNDILLKHRKLVSQSDDEDGKSLQQDETEAQASPAERVSSTPQPGIEYDENENALPDAPMSATSPLEYPSGYEDLSHSSIYGPPLTQLTPPPLMKTRAGTRKAPMSTAKLQSLLPRRRRQVVDSYPLPAFNLSSRYDENVLPVEDSSDTGNDVSEFVQSKRQADKSTIAKTSRATGRPLQQKSPNVMKQKQARTYARKKATVPEDSEPQHSNNDLTTTKETAKSNELEAARKKFAEVDAWEMEFENLTNEDSRASSQGWR
ncbi:hypothetical protein AMS68_006748 [Peltaster fructicola]|uniref:Uncharacterized protein n=1 Tax=Peltaster fructicola TaxID=286661 RepID=A0A6H0Y2U4_9PEZI|nr:hypothetical protein AMS68_006748 [Peltaster fructicola]